MAVTVTRADGTHRLAGGSGLVEVGNRWLAHLEARNYSPATVRGYAFDLVSLGRFLDDAQIDWTELVPSDVFDWLEWQARPASTVGERVVSIGQARGAAPSTMNRRVAAARRLFEYAVMCGLVDQNPVPVPRRSSGLRARRSGLLGHVAGRRTPGPARLVRQDRPLPERIVDDHGVLDLVNVEHHARVEDLGVDPVEVLVGQPSFDVVAAGPGQGVALADLVAGVRILEVGADLEEATDGKPQSAVSEIELGSKVVGDNHMRRSVPMAFPLRFEELTRLDDLAVGRDTQRRVHRGPPFAEPGLGPSPTLRWQSITVPANRSIGRRVAVVGSDSPAIGREPPWNSHAAPLTEGGDQ